MDSSAPSRSTYLKAWTYPTQESSACPVTLQAELFPYPSWWDADSCSGAQASRPRVLLRRSRAGAPTQIHNIVPGSRRAENPPSCRRASCGYLRSSPVIARRVLRSFLRQSQTQVPAPGDALVERF